MRKFLISIILIIVLLSGTVYVIKNTLLSKNPQISNQIQTSNSSNFASTQNDSSYIKNIRKLISQGKIIHNGKEIYVGMPKNEIINRLGKPDADVSPDGFQILQYKDIWFNYQYNESNKIIAICFGQGSGDKIFGIEIKQTKKQFIELLGEPDYEEEFNTADTLYHNINYEEGNYRLVFSFLEKDETASISSLQFSKALQEKQQSN